MSRLNKDKERRRDAQKNLRNAMQAGNGKSRLDDHEFEEEDDVYDIVDEEEYAAIVESR
jgi:hypothetical protein